MGPLSYSVFRDAAFVTGERPGVRRLWTADWTRQDSIPDTIRALLAELGRVYVPALLANAKALMDGAEQVETKIDGKPWVQQPLPYQRKCLQWLREKLFED